MNSEDGFSLTIGQENGSVSVRIVGDLDGRGACQVERALDRLSHLSKAAKLTVDLGGMREFDYFGVVTFAKAMRAQINRFREVSLTGLEGSRENLFKRFGLENAKVIHVPSEEGTRKGV